MLNTTKSRKAFFKTLVTFTLILFPWFFAIIYLNYVEDDTKPKQLMLKHYKVDRRKLVDHTKFEILQQDFETAHDVTEACLSCHNKTAEEFMTSNHWNWSKTDSVNGEPITIGKENVPNNYCIGIKSNEKLCSHCHAGYGWADNDFDFKAEKSVDCLVCHDNTGRYKKPGPGKGNVGAGYPDHKIDLRFIASHVGATSKKTCGYCHFYGGGGNNVKHGDLEAALLSKKDCTKEVDVHMNHEGKNMDCSECHTTSHHEISGNMYTLSTSPENATTCVQCHTDSPHKSKLLNTHFNTIACQTCHIPEYAKVNPTRVWWDWSTSGKHKDGKPYNAEDIERNDSTFQYHAKHGDLIAIKNATPDYIWFNGHADIHLFGDKFEGDTLVMNKLEGSFEDHINPAHPEHPSKIYPVKIMRGKQPYDTEHRMLLQPNTFGPKGSGAYWADFDLDKAFENGMKARNLPYSGKYDFVYTESYWPLNHMVSPSDKALSCKECHSRDGRLSKLSGFYIPGRDNNNLVDTIGILLIISALIGVVIHATIRIISKRN